jgi:hypothetical protein
MTTSRANGRGRRFEPHKECRSSKPGAAPLAVVGRPGQIVGPSRSRVLSGDRFVDDDAVSYGEWLGETLPLGRFGFRVLARCS